MKANDTKALARTSSRTNLLLGLGDTGILAMSVVWLRLYAESIVSGHRCDTFPGFNTHKAFMKWSRRFKVPMVWL